jgi:hypothetical protein
MADTQSAGLGFLILRRWRGKHASPPGVVKSLTPERHGVSSHFFCRVKKVTALTPGAGNRSSPIRKGFPPPRTIGQRPSVHASPHSRPFAALPPPQRQRRGLIPAWGTAPGFGPQMLNSRAEGPIHRFRPRTPDMKPGFQPSIHVDALFLWRCHGLE